MRYWSIGFIAIAVFALLISVDSDWRVMEVARTAFGAVLALFVLWLLWHRFNDRDGQQD
jgi:uncharacterized membrane protein YccC